MEYKNLPDLKGLATLRAVVELGGVNQAAKALHLGQPAITKRLRALEQCYQTNIMQRKGRKLGLTPAGKLVYSYASLALDHQESLIQELIDLKRGKNLLRLEVTTAIGEHLLPELLISFNDNYPNYRIQSRMGYSRNIQTRLATGLTDIALLELAPEHPDIQVKKWRDDELLLVCSPKHPISKNYSISTQQLTSLDYVLREPQSSIRAILDKKLLEFDISHLPTSFEVGSNDAIIEILGKGRHLSFLPRFAVKDALNSQALKQIQVKGLDIEITLWIARNKANINNAIAQAFFDLLNT
jgi:DNA-binding transcriptional LysR family regulator